MSVAAGIFASMFDESLPAPEELSGLSDADLAQAASTWAATSAAAEARKFAVIAEIERRAGTGEAHPRWIIDDLDAAAAALSCALTISHGRALGQIGIAVALRDRLPKVGARFLDGHISVSMISTIMARTYLVLDDAALARIDSEIAERAPDWGPLSRYKLEQSIDLCVQRYDPDAVRRVRNSVRGRRFTIGHRDDATGITSVFGRLSSTDAALLEQRIAAMISSVCEDDPRTLAQRRADAVGAIAAHATRLACRCDNDACTAKGDDGRASSVVVHVIAEKESLDEKSDRKLNGVGIDPPPAPGAAGAAGQPRRNVALIPGSRGAVVPAPLLAELIAYGAKVRIVGAPVGNEDSYRPSTALQEFIRTRDLTCRFPGCDRPAVHADIDHTQPWPAGTTHPGNLKCYCRRHHLLKTFWTGPNGWRDRQEPDGTVVVTTPSGLSYTTKPLSSLLFPRWSTASPWAPKRPATAAAASSSLGRQLRMPTRRRTREQSRLARITAERRSNAAQRAHAAERTTLIPRRVADRNRSPYTFHTADHVPDYGDDPPPF